MKTKHGILIIVFVGFILFVWYMMEKRDRTTPPINTEVVATSTAEREIPILYRKPVREVAPIEKEYRNEYNWFQLTVPVNAIVTEERQPGGIRVITLEEGSDKKLTMFIVPHGDPEITQYRMDTDLPSGIMENRSTIEVDSVNAQVFDSERSPLGATTEIWFVAKGFLYEIYVPTDQADWMKDTLKNWQFL